MGKVGRRKDKAWERVTLLEGGGGWKCNDCGEEFASGVTRIKAHVNKVRGKGIEPCEGKANSSNDSEHNLLHSQGQIQADDAQDQERIQVGPSFFSNWENEDLQMMKRYVFECLRPEDKVIVSPLSYLTREEFITLEPETFLDSLVIDIFVEILTDIERKKKTVPSNWYLPVTFSNAAVKGKVGHFLNVVHGQKMKENYMSDLEACEKIFIPVHVGPRLNGGHFYLYIIHLKNKKFEIWDSLRNTSLYVAEIEETTKKLLLAMEKLFEKVTFTKFDLKMPDDILLQPNGFDCGVFVINYMQQSDNYVMRESSFQFDSQKEREDLALKLLTNVLNQEKKNLYDKARRHYAQVEKQDGCKRLRVDKFDRVNRHDGLEKDLIGEEFQRYTKQIREWIKDEKVSAIGVWGMGGSGKTALANHIYDKLLEEADIEVIWVTVSQNSIYELQKVIAGSIKLDISDEFEVKRIARKLFQAFKKMKKCIVILDDVCDHFFLKEVGFPMTDNRIKLILTTRIWEVCQGIGCKEYTIKVERLHHEDSWTLFKKIIGFHEDMSLEVQKIAQNIARHQCDGFPLAIVRIATSMKGKIQAREWSHMLKCLENLDNGQYEIEKWVLPILRSSYDFLSKKLQRFFLDYALSHDQFHEESAWIGRFVYENMDDTKELSVQYDEGYNMLDRLKNHSMLESRFWGLRMNKFLIALAIGIAEDTSKIMANAFKNLTEIPSDDQWREDLQRVILTGNNIQTIPYGTRLRCSQLSTLLLDGNENLNYISDEFFNNMPVLKILDLSSTSIERLPESVSTLKYLNALLLSGCEALSYIPSLSKLKRLISLDLSCTAITEAPMGLESLVNLRCLNLLYTYMLMSSSVISKLINLEHLLGLEVTEKDIQGLDDLKVIVAFFDDISVFNTYAEFLDKNCKLRSFHLIFGDAGDRDDDELKTYREYCSNSMKRITFWDMDLGNGKAVLPGDIKELFINNCQRVGTVGNCLCSVVLSYAHNNNIPHQIERLDISDGCEDVEYLCCISGSCPFCSSSQLVGRLYLDGLEDLKDIVPPHALPSSHQPVLFSHLTDLKIEECDSMETLMTPKLLALLQNLHTVEVSHCGMMKEIVGEGHNADPMALMHDHLSDPIPITLPKLTSLQLNDMRQLNFVYRGIMLCPSLQTFSAKYCFQLNLPRIENSNGRLLPMKKTSSGYSWEIKTD